MPQISLIPAVTFATPPAIRGENGSDVSALIAPPYDVLDERSKAALLAGSPHNIVAIDLPHLPAKTVGPDEAYARAGATYREWLTSGVLTRRAEPALFVYQQTYEHAGRRFQRRGLIANVAVQPFGKSADGRGGIYPHEQTFSEAKEDRLKLMRSTKAQLSPIFGLYADPGERVHRLLTAVIEARPADLYGTTPDGVLHEAWAVDDARETRPLIAILSDADLFIADGHHRYNTTLNYRRELAGALAPVGGGVARGGRGADTAASRGGEVEPELPPDHPANRCLFVLVSMHDPGMIVLPTHRVLGGMSNFTWDRFTGALSPYFRVKHFPGKDLAELEAALPRARQIPGTGSHAMGLYNPADADRPLWIITSVEPDPLWETHRDRAEAWRELDVAIVQHLIVERICQPNFCAPGEKVAWKFPHTHEEFREAAHAPGSRVGILRRPTPLAAVRTVSDAGELMPQKSTFFYPKLATGMVINPLE
jgi:uncharacterized protein (DUF1015 family)